MCVGLKLRGVLFLWRFCMHKKFPLLILLTILLLSSCTGCDNTPANTTLDLSSDRTILMGTLWEAQETYTVNSRVWAVMDVNSLGDPDNHLGVAIYPDMDRLRIIKSAFVDYLEDQPTFIATIGNPEAYYDMRITCSQLGETVLTLTAYDNSQMFFSPVPNSKGLQK